MHQVKLYAVFGMFTKFEIGKEGEGVPLEFGIQNGDGVMGVIPLFASLVKAERFSKGQWPIKKMEIMVEDIPEAIEPKDVYFRDVEEKG